MHAPYLLLLAFATASGRVGVPVFEAHAWLAAAAVPLVGLYAFHRVLRERIPGTRHAAAAVLLWLGFAALYLDFLRDSGILVAELAVVLAAPLLGSFLLPLAAVALVPWSFGLIRHS